jgi:hypothetical protein
MATLHHDTLMISARTPAESSKASQLLDVVLACPNDPIHGASWSYVLHGARLRVCLFSVHDLGHTAQKGLALRRGQDGLRYLLGNVMGTLLDKLGIN